MSKATTQKDELGKGTWVFNVLGHMLEDYKNEVGWNPEIELVTAEIYRILRQHYDIEPDPVENNKADTQEGVDEVWEKEFEEIVEAEDLSPSNRSALALDMVKQLLQQKPQKQVTRDEISKFLRGMPSLIGGRDCVSYMEDWLKELGREVKR